MRISSVQVHLLSYPLPEPLTLNYYGGQRTIHKRDAMFIRVATDQGLMGYAPGQASEKAKHGIESAIVPFLEGRTLTDPDALRVQFLEGPGHDLELQKLYCSVEVALYDLAGKAKGLPVSELLGGRMRDRIRLYGSAGMYQSPDEYAAEAKAIAQLGFRGYKMRPGMGPEQDLETVRRMREAVGPDFDLMVDAHTWWRMGDRSYTPETIAKMAEAIGELDAAWLEEPLPPDDHEGFRRIKELDCVPIASGEHEPDEAGFLDLIQTSSVDYVQMDLVCQGGYPTGRRVLAGTERAGLKFAFHSWGTALEVLAAAHLGICYSEQVAEWLEYPCYSTQTLKSMYPFPLAGEILKDPLRIEGGELVVPRLPGLGIDVDESVIERYPWIPGPWSFFRIDSPPETRAVTADHSEPWFGDMGSGMASRSANPGS